MLFTTFFLHLHLAYFYHLLIVQSHPSLPLQVLTFPSAPYLQQHIPETTPAKTSIHRITIYRLHED